MGQSGRRTPTRRLRIIFALAVLAPAVARADREECTDRDVQVEKPKGPTKGAFLLIHGSAPFNADGTVPSTANDTPYSRDPFFRDLAAFLRDRGFLVVRYAKPGVHVDRIEPSVYAQTDFKCLAEQIRAVARHLPRTHPRLVLAWSEGTLHVRALPLREFDGVVLLGGIATNLSDVITAQGGPPRAELSRQVAAMKRNEMIGVDRPAGRVVDELALDDNWKEFARFPHLRVLVLHGGADREVPPSQAATFRAHLPQEQATVVVYAGLDHRFMPQGRYDLSALQKAVGDWLDRAFPTVGR